MSDFSGNGPIILVMVGGLLGSALLVAIMYVFFKRAMGADAPLAPPVDSGFMPPGASDEVLRCLRAGQKIEAIKIYRQQTGVGLKQAKDAVEALERQASLGDSPFGVTSAALSHTPPNGALPTGASAEVLRCLHAGQKIEAIKIYRQQTGVGLKEAKDAVEAMEREMR